MENRVHAMRGGIDADSIKTIGDVLILRRSDRNLKH